MPNSRASDAEETARPQGAAPPLQDAPAPDALSVAEAQIAGLEDRYKRSLADLDNYRKRAARETERRVQDSREALLREWLEALDSVERAIAMEPSEELLGGLRAVLEQMEAILERQGVQRLGAVGERFDPERHDAIGVRFTDDVPDQTIVEVARSGFALGDRVLRPAQAIVSRAAGGGG